MSTHEPTTSSTRTARKSGGGRVLVIGLVLLVAALVAAGVFPRLALKKQLVAEAHELAAPPALTVVHAHLGDPSNTLSLPATVYGLHETALYVRTNGYVKSLRVDMGSRVRAGETLAVVETPELDQELNQARANLEQIQATGELARATMERWKSMRAQGAATPQEFEEKQAAYNASRANASAASANIERLTELKRFGTLIAPFAGVVTARNTDVGALVAPATGTGTRPLFALVQVDTLRVVTNVPQHAAADVREGQSADVLVQELGGAAFKGRVMRTARALDLATRSLLTEIQLTNRDGRLLPGMFAQVQLALPKSVRALLVPANTLIIRQDGPQVAVVRENVVHIVKVVLGRDYGTEVEVLSGLTAADALVVNPGDDLTEGVSVRVVEAAAKP